MFVFVAKMEKRRAEYLCELVSSTPTPAAQPVSCARSFFLEKRIHLFSSRRSSFAQRRTVYQWFSLTHTSTLEKALVEDTYYACLYFMSTHTNTDSHLHIESSTQTQVCLLRVASCILHLCWPLHRCLWFVGVRVCMCTNTIVYFFLARSSFHFLCRCLLRCFGSQSFCVVHSVSSSHFFSNFSFTDNVFSSSLHVRYSSLFQQIFVFFVE